MRGWLVTLMTVSTAASLLLAVWYWRRVDSSDLEPPMEIASVPDRVPVLAGSDGQIEVLIRSYLPESGQDAFNRERLDALLGLRNPGLDYVRLWIINRGDAARDFDLTTAVRFTLPGNPDWRSLSLAELIAESAAEGEIAPADRFVLEGLARSDIEELAPQAFVELVVALPRNPDWRGLDRVLAPAFGDLELKRAEVAPDALDDFQTRPRGELLDRLVFPTTEPSALQASSR